MDIRKKVGDRIRRLRSEKSMTQEALSFRAELDKAYLSEVENGKRNISVVNLEKIILALNICMKDFFSDDTFKAIGK